MPIINSLKSVTAFGMLACSLIVAAGNRVVAVAPQEESAKPPRTGLTTEPTPTIPPQRRFSETRQRQLAYLRYIEAQRLKGEAQRQRSTRLLEDAIKAYKDTIQLDPSAPDPHVDLGELYFLYLSRRDLAEREALEAIRLDPKSVDGHLLLARLYVSQTKTETNARSSNLDRAIREYEKVAELDHNQAEAWALLSDLYQIKNDQERRANALEKWAAALPPNDTFFYRWLMNSELSSDQAYFQLSQLYLSQGRNQAAIDAARRAYEADPESNANARNLINILRVAGTSEEELRIYSQLVKSANSPALLIGYGSALVRARRNAEAVERLQEYVKLDQTNASALALLAIAQRRSNQRPAAIGTLKAGIAHVDSSTKLDLQIMLAETYEESGRNEEAIAQYEQIFESFLPKGSLTSVNMPLFSEVVNRLARVYRRVGNQVRLQTMLARTRRVIDERNPLLDVVAIDSLREDGRRREALEQVQSATRRFPDDRVLKFTEALILNEMKRFKESLALLHEMLKGTPDQATDDAGVYVMLSSVQMQSGDLKTAEESARKALELNPDDGDALIQLSSVLDRAERYGEAEKILRELVQRDPDHPTALNNLGYFLLERGDRYEEALKLITQAIEIEPINGSFLDSLGWAYYKLGNSEKAHECLEKAVIYARRNPTIHEHLGDVLRNLGRIAEARRQWEKALEFSIQADEIARIKIKLKDAR